MISLIKNLHIQNFKSVRDLSLECDRINIFIGKPNAGKSNILEAISLLGAGYSEGKKFMEGMVRYTALYQLFNNFDTRNDVLIEIDNFCIALKKDFYGESFKFSLEPLHIREERRENQENDFLDTSHKEESHHPWRDHTEEYVSNYRDGDYSHDSTADLIEQTRYISLLQDGKVTSQNTYGHNRSPVKKYEFKLQNGGKGDYTFLTPPHGGNFYNIIRSHLELREEIQQFLKPNGLELLLDEEAKRVSILQREAASVLSFPLHLVPDTFQRYIFHLAAIMSNRDSVLLFEEPESHSYPPYIHQLAQYILDDEGGNQYFITTHNPYLLTPILQEGKGVALFVTWFENYQTHARRLSEEEIGDILNYGMDVFLNLNHFIPE